MEQESQTDVTGASWAPAGPGAPEETGRLGRSGGRRPTSGLERADADVESRRGKSELVQCDVREAGRIS